MHTVWIVVGVVVVLFILLLLMKSKACGDCDCCCDCGECCDCCTISSLPMFVIGTVALWGGGLAAVAWLVVSLVRA